MKSCSFQKGFSWIAILLLVVTAIGLLAAAFYLGKTFSNPANKTGNYSQIEIKSPAPDDLNYWALYRHPYRGFSFKYPPSWNFKVDPQKSDDRVVDFLG